MRNGFLPSLMVLCLTGSAALAQAPYHYPPPYSPAQGYPGYAAVPPKIMVGGALQADGPIYLPAVDGPPKPFTPTPSGVYYPSRPSGSYPANISGASAKVGQGSMIQQTSGDKNEPDASAAITNLPTPNSASHHGGEIVEHAEEVSGSDYYAPDHAPSHDPYRPLEYPRGYKFYGSLDYLFWWVSPQSAPPLAIFGPATNPITQIGGGDLNFDNNERQGGRFTAGMWLNNCQTWGIEATYLFLGERAPSQTLSSGGDPILSRPFIDANTFAPSGFNLSNPGIQSGSTTIEAASRLWGIEAMARRELCRFQCGHLDFLGGVRFLQLDEHLAIRDNVQFESVPVNLSDANITINDYFGTENQFVGAQFGLQSQVQFGRFYVDLWGKFAFGNNRQTVQINGSTVILAPPAPVGNVNAPGGILAQATNSGEFGRNQFAIVPEFGFKAGFRITDYIRVAAGYSVLYINDAIRPGDQIDPVVNPTQVPVLFQGPFTGVNRPAFQFRDSDFWAHGVNIELEYRY